MYLTQTTELNAVSFLIYNTVNYGWKAKTVVRLRLSNAALRTIDKNGIECVLAELRAGGLVI